MKNLNKRTKVILATVSVVIVVVMAIAAFIQVGGGKLFGCTNCPIYTISPSNPTIHIGKTIGLSVTNSNFVCRWNSSNPTVISLVNYVNPVGAVTVKGNAAGNATITAVCFIPAPIISNTYTYTTGVTVIP